MSHELRTPLNAINGFAQLLLEEHYGPLNEKQIEYASHIDTSGSHLLTLITDLLDVSKIDVGVIELDFGEVSIESLVGSVDSMERETCAEK